VIHAPETLWSHNSETFTLERHDGRCEGLLHRDGRLMCLLVVESEEDSARALAWEWQMKREPPISPRARLYERSQIPSQHGLAPPLLQTAMWLGIIVTNGGETWTVTRRNASENWSESGVNGASKSSVNR
jgi:hypothetical protein